MTPPNARHWVNAEKRSPTRCGFYRVAEHPNALEYFAHWDGRKWSAPATSAAKARMAVGAMNHAPRTGRWWSGLQECDRDLFSDDEFGKDASPVILCRWCTLNPAPFRVQLQRLAGKV